MRLVVRLLPVLAASALAAGCGEEEPVLSAGEAISELNERGAGLELGAPLDSSGLEVHAVEFTSGAGDDVHGHAAGGSLVVATDVDAAREEHARCERALTLLCYRAANIVLRFEGRLAPDQSRRLTSALEALARE